VEQNDMKLSRTSRLALLTGAAFGVIFPVAAQEKPKGAVGHASIAQLERDLPGLMSEAEIPGLTIATVSRGKLAWNGNFGVKNSKTGELVTDETIFEAASLSKPVFAYAVLKLVDQGKLALDTPLSTYLPKPYLEGDERLGKITARLVLSHRTGFPNWRGDGPLKILFTPGERFSYSGEGFVYLQTVVEKIAGKPLEEVMNQLVFTPLGMTSSSYTWRADFDARTAYGHDADGVAAELRKDQHFNAAASLNTTSRDYAVFLAAILNGTGLKPSTLREMETPQIAVDPQCTNCTDRTPGELSKNIFWGLGWGIEKEGGSKRLWHWGDNGDFKCFVAADPAHRSAAVMFTNSDNGLAIAAVVFREATGRAPLELEWLKYDSYDSEAMRFRRAVRDGSVEAAIRQFDAALKSGAIPENSINSLGYRLLRKKRLGDAVCILQLNTELHPQSANAWDSLAEAYMNSGDKPQAIEFYEKSLTLNPKNDNAVVHLKKLHEPAANTAKP
jgi:CubicO group peptidase (beta-lactamase class C family)